jgi:hypothetical protein
MLSVTNKTIMLIVTKLSVVILNVIMVNVVSPTQLLRNLSVGQWERKQTYEKYEKYLIYLF